LLLTEHALASWPAFLTEWVLLVFYAGCVPFATRAECHDGISGHGISGTDLW